MDATNNNNNNNPGDMPNNPAADGHSTGNQGSTTATGQGSKFTGKQYMIPMLAGIAFMIVLGFIVTIFAGTLHMNQDIQALLQEHEGLLTRDTLGPRIRNSFSPSMNTTSTGCGSHPSVLTSVSATLTSAPATAQTDASQAATGNSASSSVKVSGGSVTAASSALPINGVSSKHPVMTSMVTVTVTVVATEIGHNSVVSGSGASTSGTETDGEFTSTTTVTIGVTSFVTVTATLNPPTAPASNASSDQSMSASGSVASTTGSPLTAQPVSTVSSTTTRKVTSVVSGITKTVTITETITSGLATGMSGTAGTITSPAATANATWNSSGAFPHGPASTSLFPSISGASKPKTKGGNSGNGASGSSCILMLTAIAIGFFSL